MPIAVCPRLDEAHQLSASLIQTPTCSGRSQPEWQRNGWFYPLGHNLTRPDTIGSILHGVHAPADYCGSVCTRCPASARCRRWQAVLGGANATIEQMVWFDLDWFGDRRFDINHVIESALSRSKAGDMVGPESPLLRAQRSAYHALDDYDVRCTFKLAIIFGVPHDGRCALHSCHFGVTPIKFVRDRICRNSSKNRGMTMHASCTVPTLRSASSARCNDCA